MQLLKNPFHATTMVTIFKTQREEVRLTWHIYGIRIRRIAIFSSFVSQWRCAPLCCPTAQPACPTCRSSRCVCIQGPWWCSRPRSPHREEATAETVPVPGSAVLMLHAAARQGNFHRSHLRCQNSDVQTAVPGGHRRAWRDDKESSFLSINVCSHHKGHGQSSLSFESIP